MNIENVIFLGAGASASEGAPLQGDLFKEYFLSYQKKTGSSVYHEMDRELATFFDSFYGIDVDYDKLENCSFPTFEEVIGILELALSRGESFKDYGLGYNSPRIQQIREHLILLIALILDEKLKGENKYHSKLVNRLSQNVDIIKTCFISLNYDILIDNALLNLYPDYDLDYGVNFTNFDRSDVWIKPKRNQSVFLLKLHGSLNWLYCPTCISLTLTPKDKKIIKLKWQPQECVCPNCHSLSIPIVIPPTFFKVMSNFYLQEIWRQSEIALKQSKRIFFCGYSFPDADIHVKYLLKRVEVNRDSTPKVFIINQHHGKSADQANSERLRYERFFRNRQLVHYTNLSFEDFSKTDINSIQ